MAWRAVVDVQKVIDRVIGDVNVRFAVAVHIHDHHAEALARFFLARFGRTRPQAGFLAHICKGTVAVVPVKPVRQTCERLRRADVAEDFGAVAGAAWIVGKRPVDVLADVKVGIAVAVEVGPGCAGAP